ncbi:hypothetical protein [Sphingobium sp. BS19]|uniref:hypothetical protein n=1 Tax=Sphingobium sp. BS19 TaxID=3018973 RepID=UPI0022EFB930|nr:hypothetical protein Sbs19_22790 [Sphingobium sp. BS19]
MLVAFQAVDKGGTVACAGIHMSDISAFPYATLWGERRIVSVANLTRDDGTSFLEVADRSGLKPSVSFIHWTKRTTRSRRFAPVRSRVQRFLCLACALLKYHYQYCCAKVGHNVVMLGRRR